MDETEPMEVAHGDGGAFPCPFCERVFPSKASLVSHRAAKHAGRRDRTQAKKDRPPAPPRPAARGRRKPLKTDLEVMYRFFGQVWSVRDPICGGTLYNQAPVLAESIDSWAESSPRVQEAVEKLLSGAGVIGVLAAHAPIVIVVFQHHGPQSAAFFPPAPAPEEAATNGAGPEPGPEPAWANAGPVASGYEPASADRARD